MPAMLIIANRHDFSSYCINYANPRANVSFAVVFASPIFLFLFLPLFLAAYFCTPKRLRSLLILLGSSVFYGWWRVDFLALLYAIILFSWGMGLAIERWRNVWLLRFGVIANLLTLGYFKYWNFGLDSLQAFGITVPPEWLGVVLPIGISFFVFHAISYIVDVWRRDTPATRNLFDFAAFITLFPHLIAGPVLRYKDLAWQFANRAHSLTLFSEGAYRFMAGFAMKVLVADSVAPLADAAFELQQPTMAEAWLGVSAYTIQIFFDFAGYSAMAVGLALMMGFRFIENFNNPYTSRSMTEFWQRWHISLSTWLRDYLYIPLGGNRKGRLRTYINLLATMLLGGLWHGANWTFLIWGAWHGVLLVLERMGLRLPGIFGLIYTLLAIMIGWVFFRSADLASAVIYLQGMAGLHGYGFSADMIWQLKKTVLLALAAGMAITAMLPLLNRYRFPVQLSKDSVAIETRAPVWLQLVVIMLFVAAVSRLLALSYSPFLYFQF